MSSGFLTASKAGREWSSALEVRWAGLGMQFSAKAPAWHARGPGFHCSGAKTP